VFDIGIGEIIALAALGLLIFGPDKLPKAAADGARFLKQIRTMAAGAKQDLADSAGLDLTDAVDTVKGLADLHPKRIASSLLKDEPAATPRAAQPPPPGAPTFDPDAT
jgi:sec-independent protein translocase protein TatB